MSPFIVIASTQIQTCFLECPQGHLRVQLYPVQPQQVTHSICKGIPYGGEMSYSR